MRFTTIAIAVVASACAAFALPAEVNAATNVTVVEARRVEPEVWVWPVTNYGGTEGKVFKKEGSHSFQFDAKSWQYYDFGCCVRFCKNSKSTGYRCNADSANPAVATANRFNKVVIKCGGGTPSC